MLAHRHRLSRRSLGLGALGLAVSALLSAPRGAASAREKRRFLFVHAVGGWDPLCVFAPLFGAPDIQMEKDAEPLTIGDFRLVGSPARPSVPAFFQKWGGRTLLVNGLSTRSVNHETCQTIALTGGTRDDSPDWPTLLGLADEGSYHLPHLVLSGPVLPGPHSVLVSRAEGLLSEAVHGDVLELCDAPVEQPGAAARDAVSAHIAARAAELASASGHPVLEGVQAAVARARRLTGDKHLVKFTDSKKMRDRAEVALASLASGLCRCATVSTGADWDTHVDNARQSSLFEELFSDLDHLMERALSIPVQDGAPLAEELHVVVLSEMGRMPAYNGQLGRDHWPYTSALIIGPGVTGGRTIGGYSDLYNGIGADPASGEPDPSRPGVDAAALGATLLALGGADPAAHVEAPEVLTGVLS